MYWLRDLKAKEEGRRLEVSEVIYRCQVIILGAALWNPRRLSRNAYEKVLGTLVNSADFG